MNDKIPRRVIKYFPFLPSLAWSIFEFLEYYRNIVMVSGSWSSRKQHCSINSQDGFIDIAIEILWNDSQLFLQKNVKLLLTPYLSILCKI